MAKRKTKATQRKAPVSRLYNALIMAPQIVERRLREAEAVLNLTGGKYAE